MFESFKRLQLQRKGLSCGKTRRKQSDSEWVEVLRWSPWVKTLAFVGFVLSMTWLTAVSPVGESVFFAGRPGRRFAVVLLLFSVAFVQFFANHPNSFRRNSRVVLIFGLILLQVLLVRSICFAVRSNDIPENFTFLLIPYALGPMALSVLLGRAQGIFLAVFGSLWGCMVVPEGVVFPFLVTSLVTGFVAVYATNRVRKRSHLVRAGFYVGLAGVLLTLALGFVDLPSLGPDRAADWRLFGIEVALALLTGVVTATVVSGTLPILESLFRVTTEISWIELADLNHPLLKRMTIEAPGTYHHSLVVANLAEAAAEAIGANATQCRVCSYFHDIGKLKKPHYYIENISDGENPHDDLTPTMSALVIIAHVKDGVDLALKNKLNGEIIDVIEQHHGTSIIYYFYRKALDQQERIRAQVAEGSANEEDIPEVDQKGFRYPGPRPQTRESAIISLADSIESASRSLAKPSPAKIEQMIEEIFQARIQDGHLDECDLTLADLQVIRSRFASTLRSMLHNRISYPRQSGAEASSAGVAARRRAKAEAPAPSGAEPAGGASGESDGRTRPGGSADDGEASRSDRRKKVIESAA